MEKLVTGCVDAHRDSPVVERARRPQDGEVVLGVRGAKPYIESIEPTHITIVKVHGMPNVMALAATGWEMTPRVDHYDNLLKKIRLS